MTEADFVSNELLDIILINVVELRETQCKNTFMLAKKLIVKTSATLEPYIQVFFNQALIPGKADPKLSMQGVRADLQAKQHLPTHLPHSDLGQVPQIVPMRHRLGK